MAHHIPDTDFLPATLFLLPRITRIASSWLVLCVTYERGLNRRGGLDGRSAATSIYTSPQTVACLSLLLQF